MRNYLLATAAALAVSLATVPAAWAQSFSFGGGGVGVQFGTGGGYYGPGYGGRGYGGPGYSSGYRGYGSNYYGPNYYGPGYRGPGYGRSSGSSFGIYLGPGPSYYGRGPSYYGYRSYDGRDSYRYRSNPQQYLEPVPNRSEPAQAAPRYPSDDILALMNWRELGLVLRDATEQLGSELGRLSTGAGWQAFLKLGSLGDHFASEIDGPPTAEDAARLQATLALYVKAASNPEYDSITRKPSFAAIRSALANFTQDPLERTARRLQQFHDDLSEDLDKLPTGEGWKKHLALPSDGDAAWDKTLKRYQAVQANEEYKMIAELGPFPATLEAVAEMQQLAGSAETPQAPPLPEPR